MIGLVFKEMSERDSNSIESLALTLSHPGLRSLAHLGIARGLLEQIKRSA
jgi:hypothetical protein